MNDDYVIEKKEYPVFDEGLYMAEVTKVEPAEGKFGPQTKWWFKLIDVDVEDATLLGWTSETYTDKSKLFAWNKATLGQEFDPNADFRSGAVIGKKVQVNVSRRLDSTGGEYNKIEGLIALREKTKEAIPLSSNGGEKTEQKTDGGNGPDLWEV